MTPCGEVQDAAQLIGYQVLLGAPAGQAAILQFHTALEIHLLPATEVLDVIGRMHGSMLRMRQELHDHSQIMSDVCQDDVSKSSLMLSQTGEHVEGQAAPHQRRTRQMAT